MHVVIYGTSWASWHQALKKSELWTQFNGVCKVSHVSSGNLSVEKSCGCGDQVTLIPLSKESMQTDFLGFRTLVPNKKQFEIFNDKSLFYNFMFYNNLMEFIPRTTGLNFEPPSFPFVMKITDSAGGIGVELVTNMESLRKSLEFPLFKDKPLLLQEYVQGDIEYVTHVVCKEGIVLWEATLEGPVPQKTGMNKGAFAVSTTNLHRDHLEVFYKIFELTKFSGPACINFKISEGRPVIFEINPRFGGSLFAPTFTTQLQGALRTILQHASIENAISREA